MKLTHEMCNAQFERLDIHTKRMIAVVIAEIAAAEKKHPDWPVDIIHRAAIVSEEAGEMLRSAINHVYELEPEGCITKEAVQTAAVAIRFLKNMPRPILPGEPKDKEKKYQKSAFRYRDITGTKEYSTY